MNIKTLQALKDYIDARIEEEFASREEDSDGYRCSAIKERKTRESAWQKLIDEELKS